MTDHVVSNHAFPIIQLLVGCLFFLPSALWHKQIVEFPQNLHPNISVYRRSHWLPSTIPHTLHTTTTHHHHNSRTRNKWTYLPISRKYAPVNWVITGLGNDLSPLRRQVLTWTNTGYWSPGNTFQWILNQNFIIYIQEDAFEKCRPPNWRPICPVGDELNASLYAASATEWFSSLALPNKRLKHSSESGNSTWIHLWRHNELDGVSNHRRLDC